MSDNEIRDITKLLGPGKPLPDKYPFMLFGDNREIELVWSGKSAEVTNVIISPDSQTSKVTPSKSRI